MEKNRMVLVPQYMRNFSCIGSECEDSCCVGWNVDIDKATYKKYNKVRDSELGPLFDKQITRNRTSTHPLQYAKVKFETGPRCPFLTIESLCKIQLKLGEDYLSNTCSTYPRVLNKVGGKFEKSAVISCPEAARLALLNPDGIEFDEIEEPIGSKNIIFSEIDCNTGANIYFWDLRIFTIQVLQNRDYSLADRLVILGMFYKKAQKYLDDNRPDDIPSLIASYTSLINEGIFKEELREIPVENTVQMELLAELTAIRYDFGISSARYVQCLKEMFVGLGYRSDSKVEEVAIQYMDVYNKHYEPFMSGHEYIMENYLVNHVYKNLFPITNSKPMFDNYVLLVIHYAMIKLHLIGMAGYHKEDFGIDLVIKLIQSFAKTVEHNKEYLSTILELLQKNQFMTLGYMSILIKN